MLDGWPTFDGQVYAGQRRRGGCPIFRVPCEKWGAGSATRLRSSTLRPRAVVASAATTANGSCEAHRLRGTRARAPAPHAIIPSATEISCWPMALHELHPFSRLEIAKVPQKRGVYVLFQIENPIHADGAENLRKGLLRGKAEFPGATHFSAETLTA